MDPRRGRQCLLSGSNCPAVFHGSPSLGALKAQHDIVKKDRGVDRRCHSAQHFVVSEGQGAIRHAAWVEQNARQETPFVLYMFDKID